MYTGVRFGHWCCVSPSHKGRYLVVFNLRVHHANHRGANRRSAMGMNWYCTDLLYHTCIPHLYTPCEQIFVKVYYFLLAWTINLNWMKTDHCNYTKHNKVNDTLKVDDYITNIKQGITVLHIAISFSMPTLRKNRNWNEGHNDIKDEYILIHSWYDGRTGIPFLLWQQSMGNTVQLYTYAGWRSFSTSQSVPLSRMLLRLRINEAAVSLCVIM